MQLTKLTAVVIACGLLVGLAAPWTPAAEERAAPVRVGVVDMAKVLDGYPEFQESDKQYKKLLEERQVQIGERMSLRLLTADELKEYQNLKSVVAPSDDQKKRMEALRQVAEGRETELKGLQMLAGPNDDQKKRLTDLRQTAEKANAELDQMRTAASDEISKRNRELSEKLNQRIESALAAVAKDKRVDLVVAKDAVLFGGIDLTADLLAKLKSAS